MIIGVSKFLSQSKASRESMCRCRSMSARPSKQGANHDTRPAPPMRPYDGRQALFLR